MNIKDIEKYIDDCANKNHPVWKMEFDSVFDDKMSIL